MSRKLGPEHRAAYVKSWYRQNRERILAKQSTPQALARRRELEKLRQKKRLISTQAE